MKNITHEVSQIAPHIWCISEFKLVNAFLVEGEKTATLIDTGCGIGNIRKTAEQLTNRPITVLLTHGHPDHNGGVYRFKDCPVYMHPVDQSIAETCACTNEIRRCYIETRVPVRFPGEGHMEALLHLLPNPEPEYQYDWKPIEEGSKIDLGGRQLQVIHTPGHTDGSVCFLDQQSGILFSGDTVNHSIILVRQPGNDKKLIRIYHDSLKKLWNLRAGFDCLAIGHDGITIPKKIIEDYLELTTGLLSGEIIGGYEEVGIRKGDVARFGTAELWYQCDQ